MTQVFLLLLLQRRAGQAGAVRAAGCFLFWAQAERRPRKPLVWLWLGGGSDGGDMETRGQTLSGGLWGCWFLRPRPHSWEGEAGSDPYPR